MIKRALNNKLHLFFAKGLGQIIECPLLDSFDRSFQRSKRREQNDGGIRAEPLELPQDGQAIHSSHANICEHQVEQRLLTASQRVRPVGKGLHLMPVLFQGIGQEFAGHGIVIDHKNLCCRHSAP